MRDPTTSGLGLESLFSIINQRKPPPCCYCLLPDHAPTQCNIVTNVHKRKKILRRTRVVAIYALERIKFVKSAFEDLVAPSVIVGIIRVSVGRKQEHLAGMKIRRKVMSPRTHQNNQKLEVYPVSQPRQSPVSQPRQSHPHCALVQKIWCYCRLRKPQLTGQKSTP